MKTRMFLMLSLLAILVLVASPVAANNAVVPSAPSLACSGCRDSADPVRSASSRFTTTQVGRRGPTTRMASN